MITQDFPCKSDKGENANPNWTYPEHFDTALLRDISGIDFHEPSVIPRRF
jgi:hypothetical protein